MLNLIYLNNVSSYKNNFITYDLMLLTGYRILRSKLLNSLLNWFSKILFKMASRQEVSFQHFKVSEDWNIFFSLKHIYLEHIGNKVSKNVLV